MEYGIRELSGMSDQEKFEALKKTAIEENEKVYGNEIRRKYGEEAVDASYGKIRGMSQQEWEDFRQMEQEILVRLQTAVQQGLNPEGTDGRQIAELHKQWLCRTWKQYSAQAHMGVAEMYTADERFKGYYDKDVIGCAEWLRSAIRFWAEKL